MGRRPGLVEEGRKHCYLLQRSVTVTGDPLLWCETSFVDGMSENSFHMSCL